MSAHNTGIRDTDRTKDHTTVPMPLGIDIRREGKEYAPVLKVLDPIAKELLQELSYEKTRHNKNSRVLGFAQKRWDDYQKDPIAFVLAEKEKELLGHKGKNASAALAQIREKITAYRNDPILYRLRLKEEECSESDEKNLATQLELEEIREEIEKHLASTSRSKRKKGIEIKQTKPTYVVDEVKTSKTIWALTKDLSSFFGNLLGGVLKAVLVIFQRKGGSDASMRRSPRMSSKPSNGTRFVIVAFFLILILVFLFKFVIPVFQVEGWVSGNRANSQQSPILPT